MTKQNHNLIRTALSLLHIVETQLESVTNYVQSCNDPCAMIYHDLLLQVMDELSDAETTLTEMK